MTGWASRNRAAMTSLYADDLARLEAPAPDAGISTVAATSGAIVLQWSGRALDSRRDPVRAAEAVASSAPAGPVVLAGLGGGYLLQALHARGVQVAAVVDHACVIAAALDARDLSAALAATRVVTVEGLTVRGRIPQLRALATALVAHAPAVTGSPELQMLCARWEDITPARRPRVLVVGPMAGGSLEVARSVHRAAGELNVETRIFDASVFGGAQQAFQSLDLPPASRAHFHGRLAMLVGDAVVETATAWRADLVLAVAQAPLAEPSLSALGARGIPRLFWFVENTRVLPYWQDVAPHYDRFYAIQKGLVLDRIRAAGAPWAGYLPMAADPEMHAPLAVTADDRQRFGSPISFAGAPYLNRRHVLAGVADLGLRVWGEGWEATALAASIGEPGRFDLATMRRVFACTAVNLNVHSAAHVTGLDPDPDYVNPRTFELAMSGAFQLVDRRGPLPALFADDEIATFESVADLRAKAEHYLARPEEAAAIAARARQRALRDHTYASRIRTLLGDSLPAHLQPDAPLSERATLDGALAECARREAMHEDEAFFRMLVDIRETMSVPR